MFPTSDSSSDSWKETNMSICPDHGGYTGDACKKCQPKWKTDDGRIDVDVARKEGMKEITKMAEREASGPPKIDPADRLTLVSLENASLKAFHKMQNAQAQFQNFAATMFEK